MLVLLDRDGVINTNLPQSVLAVDAFEFLPRSLDALALLTRAGITLAICTNQSCVGRGLISQAELDAIHAHMLSAITAHGGAIARIYAATDAPEHASDRRKPGAGMLHDALRDFHADAAHTPFIGDSLRDLQAAQAAGCPRLLVRTGHGQALEADGIPAILAPVAIYDDLYQASGAIVGK